MGWNDHNTQRLNRRFAVHVDDVDAADEDEDLTECAEAEAPAEELRGIIASVVEVHTWHNREADCTCPSCSRTDAKVYFDRNFPVFTCLKDGCAETKGRINAELFQRTKEAFGDRGILVQTPEQERADKKRRERESKFRNDARYRILPQLLARKPIPLESWAAISPYPLKDYDVKDQWRLSLAGLFKPDDIVWCGELYETGGPNFQHSFKTVHEWLEKAAPYGPQLSPCTFAWEAAKYGSRKKAWIARKDYFIAESDAGISREQFGNILLWVMREQKILPTTLRAIVDSGRVSLHGWFNIPFPPTATAPRPPAYSDELWFRWESGGREEHQKLYDAWKQKYKHQIALDEYRHRHYWQDRYDLFAALKGMGCDAHMLGGLAGKTGPLTARLPGWPRRDKAGNLTGQYQRLLYLNPKDEISL